MWTRTMLHVPGGKCAPPDLGDEGQIVWPFANVDQVNPRDTWLKRSPAKTSELHVKTGADDALVWRRAYT